MEHSPSLEAASSSAGEEISRTCNPKCSLPCSQQPVNTPYCEQCESSAHPKSLKSILILFSHIHRGLLRVPFPSGFQT
jgi:hypothetical protein